MARASPMSSPLSPPSPRATRTAWTHLHLAVLLAGGAGLFAKWLPVTPAVLSAEQITASAVPITRPAARPDA